MQIAITSRDSVRAADAEAGITGGLNMIYTNMLSGDDMLRDNGRVVCIAVRSLITQSLS